MPVVLFLQESCHKDDVLSNYTPKLKILDCSQFFSLKELTRRAGQRDVRKMLLGARKVVLCVRKVILVVNEFVTRCQKCVI